MYVPGKLATGSSVCILHAQCIYNSAKKGPYSNKTSVYLKAGRLAFSESFLPFAIREVGKCALSLNTLSKIWTVDCHVKIFSFTREKQFCESCEWTVSFEEEKIRFRYVKSMFQKL